MPSEFFEELPHNCPPHNTPKMPSLIVLRLVKSAKPTMDDFLSQASLGLERRGDTDECCHASCSVFKVDEKVNRAQQLRKLPRIRSRKHVAFLNLGPTAGRAKVSQHSNHIDLWLFKAFNPLSAIQSIEKLA
ncbi:hypothetical protein [Bradyrhizobium sp. DASA03007]|uniref:hypothetical protein n=1 Tax=unclassified Bradyrhizobium TaxID=2631580 RepID=UPI003F6ED14B